MTRRIAIIVSLILFFWGTYPVLFYADEPDKKVVIVDVIYNSETDQSLSQIVFDDSTVLADYDYVINHVTSNNAAGISTLANDTPDGTVGYYFSTVAWINRNGVVSLHLKPLASVRSGWNTANTAWNALASSTTVTSSSYWQNVTCMQWQYKCHFYYANTKDYWNLEPSRNASSYAQVVLNGCNP